MLRVSAIVLGVSDMARAQAFWGAALGYVRRAEGSGPDWVFLDPPDGRGTPIALDVSESPVQQHPRMHLDLLARDAAEQRAEVERLVGLGAARVDWDLYPADPDFVVLADTEGNPFCVIDASHG